MTIKRAALLMPVIFLLFCDPFVHAQNSQPDNFNKAKLLMMEGKYSQSIEMLQKLLINEPDSADIYYYLSLNYQALSNFQKASSALEKALNLNPEDANIMTLLGNDYYSAGRVSDADSILSKAFLLDSTNVQILIALGKVFMHEHYWGKAEDIYKKLVKLDSSNSFYYTQQAKCETALKDWENAIINFQIAHRLNPLNQNTVIELSQLYILGKKFISAMRIIDDGLKYYPLSPAMWTKKGDIYFKMKNYREAISGYQKSISCGDSSEINFRNIGISYYWIGEYDTSIVFLNHAVKLNDKDPNAYFYMGTSYKGLKRYSEAIENLSKAAKLQQNDFLAEAFIQIAATYYAQKNYPKALKYYQDALRENPDKKEVIFYLAVVYDHYYADKTVAIKYYQMFLSTMKNADKKLIGYATDRINALIEEDHFRKAETSK